VPDRPPIIKRYLQKVPGARPHIPVDPAAPVRAFTTVAARCPVLLVAPRDEPANRR
jgi:hypothetical protein